MLRRVRSLREVLPPQPPGVERAARLQRATVANQCMGQGWVISSPTWGPATACRSNFHINKTNDLEKTIKNHD
jgi:hypothetical protein